jgi:hypothetical protein
MSPLRIFRLVPSLFLSTAAIVLSVGLLLWLPATVQATPPIEGQTHAFNSAVAVSNAADDALALANGDLDRDGRLDLAFGVGSTLMVQHNDGSPFDGWDTAVNVGSAASTILDMAMADFDRDGLPDVTVVTGGSGEISVWRNPGNPFSGAWSTSNTLVSSLDSLALAVATGDLDNDGAFDLVVADADGVLHLLKNPGSAPFTTSWSTVLAMGGAGQAINDIALADLDGDNKLDIVSISGGSEDRVKVWHNDGTPFDSPWASVTLGTAPLGGDGLAVVAGDWNQDGKLDLASGDDAGHVTLWENNGAPFTSGDWGSGVELDGSGADPVYVVIASDLDNDGDLDLISGDGTNVRSWQNPRQGPGDGDTFSGSWSVSSLGSAGASINRLVAADLDCDGDADLLSASDSTGNEILAWENSLVHILWKQYTGISSAWPFASSTGSTIGTSSSNVQATALADLDHDGKLDLVSASINGQLVAFQNNGAPFDGNWPQSTIGTTGNIYALAVGDLDNDGYDDVVVGLWSSSGGNQLVIYHNDGTPFDGTWSSTVVSTASKRVNAVAVADLDNDGQPDIISGYCTKRDYHGSAECPVVAWYNNGNPFGGTWASNTVTAISYTVNSVAAGDLDNDGLTDIVIGTDRDYDWRTPVWPDTTGWPDVYQVRAYRNDGTPFSGTWTETNVGRDDTNVSKLNNHTFWGADVNYVAVADLDNDGKLDIVSTDGIEADYQVKVWKNDGTPFDSLWWGTAVWVESPWLPGPVNAAVIKDFNQDGYPDIATANGFLSSEVTVWENDGTPFGIETGSITTTLVNGTWIQNGVGYSESHNGGLSLAAGDLDRDGDIDIVEGSGDIWLPDESNSNTAWQNMGGSVQIKVDDTAPLSIAGDIETNDLLSIRLIHQGRAGNDDLEIASWRFLLLDSSGVALSNDAANELIYRLWIYQDANSDGVWQGTDTPVITLTNLSLVSGTQTITFADGDPNVRISTTTPATYFVVIRPKLGAAFYTPNVIQLVFDRDEDSVIEDRVKDTSVSIRDTLPSSSGQVLFTTHADSLFIETDPYDPINELGDAQLTSGQAITAYAVARNTGFYVANVPVTWTLINMTGNVTTTDLVPSADGKSATFFAHGAGTAQIAISSQAQNFHTFSVVTGDTSGIITVTAGAAYTVTLAANPTAIAADGQSTSTLVATVIDAYNNPVADGTQVTFTTNAGSLPANPYTSTTTGGRASVVLTSSTTLETATVTATVGACDGIATVQFVPGALAAIVVSPPAATLDPGQTQAFQVIGYDAYSHTIPGTTAGWSVVSGGGSIHPTTGLFTAAVTDGVYMNTVLATTATLTSTASVTVSNVAPNAAASGPYSGDEGLVITFDGNASFDANYDPLTYTWDFGDGSGAIGVIATHIYPDGPSSHVITLTVQDDNGASDVDTTTVTIANRAPWSVSIAGPSAVDEGSSITLTGSASDVPSDTLSYAWDVDGDGFDDGTGSTLVYTGTDGLAAATIWLRASDEDGGTTVVSHPVTVDNIAPWDVSIAGPSVVDEGSSIVLTGSASDVPSDTLSYAWDVDSDGFDDGTGSTLVYTGTDGLAAVTVRLRASDEDGSSTVVSHSVTVNNVAPWDVSIAGADTVDEGSGTTLTGSASDVAGDTLSYAWDVDGDGFDDGMGPTLVYTWADGPDAATVWLRASDEDGGSTTTSHPITVANVAPAPTITAPASTVGGQEVTFTANANDPGLDTFEYSWDWGDGTSGLITTNLAVTHTFQFVGVYTVTLSVTDSDGATGQGEQPINVTANASDAFKTHLPIIFR